MASTTADHAPASADVPRQTSRNTLGKRIWANRAVYLFMLPGLLWYVVFHYLPILGNVIAFKHYSVFVGILDSPWVGLDNFRKMINDPDFLRALKNTLIIDALQIIFAFPAPLLLALLLHSIMSTRVKRSIQSIVYLPHFL
ncbi:MAG TPA: hypothetical protein VNZ58_06125, partial [Thermomicrobiales bacterium]|nr:hypothetical protein [Thermomicrobiales bacterium]